MTSDPNKLEAALLRTMTLLATLSVAAEIRFGMQERKAGRDPSQEEVDDVVLPQLQEDLTTLKALLFQLQSSLALIKQTDAIENGMPATEPVNRFINLVRLQKTSQVLHRIHQRLLSLYPSVSESLTEEARMLKNDCDLLQEKEDAVYTDILVVFIGESRQFINKITPLL